LINHEVILYENISNHIETGENKGQRYWIVNKITSGLNHGLKMILCQIKNSQIYGPNCICIDLSGGCRVTIFSIKNGKTVGNTKTYIFHSEAKSGAVFRHNYKQVDQIEYLPG
jgi:hypothetical protein